MDNLDIFQRLALALAIGLLVALSAAGRSGRARRARVLPGSGSMRSASADTGAAHLGRLRRALYRSGVFRPQVDQREVPQQKFSFRNPFGLDWVLGFGALLSLVIVGSKLLISMFGQPGLLDMAGVSGLADVDPVTLSAAPLAGNDMMLRDAAMTILLAGAANLLTKITVPVLVGGRRFGVQLTITGVVVLIAGAAAYLLDGA